MPLYFMLHDAERFHTLIRPALAASWQQRSFAPCAALRSALAADTSRFLTENRIREEESILSRIGPELRFDREMWRFLVGEVLLVGAAELPEIHVPEETLCRLFHAKGEETTRTRFAPIQQILYGTRDLVLGGWYRPDHAGYNDKEDVIRLASYLAELSPQHCTTADLTSIGQSEEETRDELEFARASVSLLLDLYQQVQARGQIVVCEIL